MFDKLIATERQYEELMQRLGTAEVQSDPAEYRKQAKTLSEIEPLVTSFREYKAVTREIAQTEELVAGGDADMRELAQEELKALTARRDALVAELKMLLVPKDPNDEKNVVLEIRAGTGGDEAALFAGRAVPDVHAVRRASGLADRGDVDERDRRRRPQGSHRHDRRARRRTAS